MSKIRVMCNDCLRVFYTNRKKYVADGCIAKCACGSTEVCHCEMCMATVRDLKKWVKNGKPDDIFQGGGLTVAISDWSEADGATVIRPTLPAPDKGDSPVFGVLSTLEVFPTSENEPTPAPCG